MTQINLCKTAAHIAAGFWGIEVLQADIHSAQPKGVTIYNASLVSGVRLRPAANRQVINRRNIGSVLIDASGKKADSEGAGQNRPWTISAEWLL